MMHTKQRFHHTTTLTKFMQEATVLQQKPFKILLKGFHKFIEAGHCISTFRLSSSIIEAYFDHLYSAQLITTSLQRL